MKQFYPTIHTNRPIAGDFYEMVFDWDPAANIPLAGQFFTVRVSQQSVPLLRRPFAFSGFDTDKSTVSMIYQRRGTATQLLVGKRSGDQLDVIGPLGNTFIPPENDEKPIIVAGGVGIGPMMFLAQTLIHKGFRPLFVFGARSKEFVPDIVSFSALEPQVCTDDGSLGFHGTTVDFLRSLETAVIKDAVVYGCGPNPMLKACHEFAQKHGIICEVSMEQVMACGVGACMGCVIKVVREPGYARVCKEGPIFDSKDVVWT
ncbi:MAG: dihydroorotate dehydrogenase electron transfer subunit [Chitinivibrionales bacterium]